jgi:cytochrome c5
MRVRAVVLSVMASMLLVFAVGCAKQEPPKPASPAAAAPAAPAAAVPASPAAGGKALFDAKCGVCHGLDRAAVRHETKEKWASIVKEMRGRRPEWISDAEASKIVDYLAAEHGKK